MINNLIKLINKKQINNVTLNLLLIYSNDNKVKTVNELTKLIFNEYTNQVNKKGHLYCIHNEMYKMYGENVYKLGCAKNVKGRLIHYTTSYIKPSKIKYESKEMDHYCVAESILFHKLKEYRMVNNREFFNCELISISDIIEQIENEISNIPIIRLIYKYGIKNSKIFVFYNRLRKMVCHFEKYLNILFIANGIDINPIINFKNYTENVIPDQCDKPFEDLNELSQIFSALDVIQTHKFRKNIYDEIYQSSDLSKETFARLSQGSPENLTITQTYQMHKYTMKKMCGVTYFNINFIKENYKNMNMKLTNDYFFNDDMHILRNS